METVRTTSSARVRTGVALVVAAAALVAASCSSTTPAGTDGADGPGTTVDVATVLGTPNPATGSKVLVGLITEGGSEALGSQSELTSRGAQIAVEYTNEYLGGLGGHEIELFVCGNQGTPAGATDCANQMVEKKVVAVVHPYTGQGSAQVPVITGAGIPYVTLSGSSSEELTTPGVFALTGGYPTTLAAFAAKAQQEGVKRFNMIVIDVPAATSGAQALGEIVFGNADVEYEVTPVPPGTPDMSPQLQAAIDGGADALGVTGDVTTCTAFFQAYQTLALSVPRYVIPVCNEKSLIDSYGAVLDGSFETAITDTAGDDAEVYAAMLAKYNTGDAIDPNPALSPGVAAGASTVINFVNGMVGIGTDVTPASVLAQMKATQNVVMFLSGGLTYTCDGKAIAILPNVCSAEMQIGTVDATGQISDLQKIDTAPFFKT